MHSIIEIEGKQIYLCRIDSNYTIIEAIPPNDYLYLKKLREVFDKYKEKAKFTLILNDLSPDVIIGEEVYEIMVKKNPVIDKLKEIFDLEIL